MAGEIYALTDDGRFAAMTEQPYESEDLLQRLIEEYPSLLAGGQMRPTAPRRWALVAREASVASEEGGSGRWSLDHLFLDQDAVPTLVEVKRSSDTRIRREVVGQMLDYAANGVVYWPIQDLRLAFEETCTRQGSSADLVIGELIGEGDPEAFFAALAASEEPGVAAAARTLVDWGVTHAARVRWRGGASGVWFDLAIQDANARMVTLVWVSAYHGRAADVQVDLGSLAGSASFADQPSRQAFADRLRDRTRIELGRADGRPSFPLATLADDQVRAAFVEELTRVADLLRGAEQHGRG